MSERLVRWGGCFFIIICLILCITQTSHAQTLQSSNYRFEESVLNGGGLIQSDSSSFQLRNAVGDTAIGNSASTNLQIESGSITTNDPALSVIVITFAGNFGSFSPSAASVTTTTFSVSNYTSWGYAVQILGDTPTNGTHSIPAMSSTGPSVSNTEQFGINLVANTSPTSVGSNPVHGIFGVGDATANYGSPNNYRYVSGESIVTAPKSSGVTTYTITYIVNVNSLTPGGQYISNQTLVCTGTY